MSEEEEISSGSNRSWLDRLGLGFIGEPKNRQDLIELLQDAEQRKLIDHDAVDMIKGVLQVSEMQVRDVMVPRAQVVAIDHDASPEEFLPIIIESAHSRFPVIGEGRDHIQGILLAKDFLPYLFSGRSDVQLAELIRPALFIPESMRLDVLLKKFQSTRNHMAMVVDEYGGAAGMVTIEDVLEEIVGEIEDEHDPQEEEPIQAFEDYHRVQALTPIEDFNEYFKLNLSYEEYDTIGGLVVQEFGYLPEAGEHVRIGDLLFTVMSSDGRRLKLLKVSPVSE